MQSRRDFLKTSTLLALTPTVPGFLARTARAARAEKDSTILVVIQLDGGNDGINTVVPFADEGYARHRRELRIAPARLIKVNDHAGLHASLREAHQLLESRRLAIVQGVGYPNPNRSHFESMAIWHTASFDPEERNGLGWIGRALDGGNPPSRAPASVLVGAGQLPVALRGRRCIASAMTRPEDFLLAGSVKSNQQDPFAAAPTNDLAAFVQRSTLDAYSTSDRMAAIARGKESEGRYPSTDLAGRLRLIARLIRANLGTRVFYTTQSGYDTHAGQLWTHANLLSDFAGALKAFLDDLAESKLADRVAVLAFSEFGRMVKENGSAGTDHGTSGPVFLAGPGVQPGLVGATPSLTDLDLKHGDLKMEIDFRRVYAAVLEGWLNLRSQTVVGESSQHLKLFAT